MAFRSVQKVSKVNRLNEVGRTPLAQLVELLTLDLKVMSSSLTFGVEITLSLKKKMGLSCQCRLCLSQSHAYLH